MTTDGILGGLLAVLAAGNALAAVWLFFNVARRLGRRRYGTAFAYLRAKDSLRISLGFAIKATALAIIFALRIPLRVFRLMGDAEAGAAWLDATVYWQTVCTIMMLVGLTLIMWPAFSKWAPKGLSIAIGAFAALLLFCIGAAGVQLAAALLRV